MCLCIYVCARARVCNGRESRNGHRNTQERGAHSEIENPAVLSRRYEEKVKVYCKKKKKKKGMKEFSILSIPDWLFLSRPRLENSMLSFAEMRLVPSTNEAFFMGGGWKWVMKERRESSERSKRCTFQFPPLRLSVFSSSPQLLFTSFLSLLFIL